VSSSDKQGSIHAALVAVRCLLHIPEATPSDTARYRQGWQGYDTTYDTNYGQTLSRVPHHASQAPTRSDGYGEIVSAHIHINFLARR
jgi:hypothetical protein